MIGTESETFDPVCGQTDKWIDIFTSFICSLREWELEWLKHVDWNDKSVKMPPRQERGVEIAFSENMGWWTVRENLVKLGSLQVI